MSEPRRWPRMVLALGLLAALVSLLLLVRGEPRELVTTQPDQPPQVEDPVDQAPREMLQPRPTGPGRIGAADPVSLSRSSGSEVAGRVLDALGSPLSDCQVLLDLRQSAGFGQDDRGEPTSHAQDRSDEDGLFTLLAEGPGPWVLTLIHPDYPPTIADAALMLSAGQKKRLGDLQLHSEIGLVVTVRAEGGLPVPSALLTLNPVLENPELPNSTQKAMRRTALSDQTGRALFYGVNAGSYLLRAEASGLASTEISHLQQTALARPPQVRIDMPRGEVLRGRVRNSAGEPVADARILLQRRKGLEAAGTRSSDGGMFRITGLNPGPYSLRAEAPWLGSIELSEIEVPSNAGLIELQFQAHIEFTGRVLRADTGEPIPGAEIRLTAPLEWALDHAGEGERRQSSDASGSFRFESIPTGRYGLRIASKGFFPIGTKIDISEPGQAQSFALQPAFLLRGRVVDQSGAALLGAEIQVIEASYDGSQFAEFKLRALGRGLALASSRSAGEGRFQMDEIGAGEFRVRLSAAGKAERISRPFRSEPGGNLNLGDLVLTEAARLQGRALIAPGEPAARAMVCLDPLGASEPPRISHQVRADAAGNYLFEGIEAGTYELFYYYPEEQRPSTAVDSHTRSLLRIDIRAGALERQDLVLR